MKKIIKKINSLFNKRVKGGAHIYVFFFFCLLIICVIMKLVFDKKQVEITYRTVDDYLLLSLTSGCLFNTDEYTRSGNIVIYETLSPTWADANYLTYDILSDGNILMPGADSFLNKSYASFLTTFKDSLKLNSSMETSMRGISSPITLDDYSVYNKYCVFDSSNNVEHFKFVRYTRSGTGWLVQEYSDDVYPTIYNSFDKTNTTITETSIAAKISMDVKVGDYVDWLYQGINPDDVDQSISYQRLVDIKKD